ncbi:MAG: AAA family ATPase [Magnetococcales bacterium]|nr:AAA family ATPase [Magnetococcales bacterium]
MYLDHFGLDNFPFQNTPDINRFFGGGQRGMVLDSLVSCILDHAGVLLVVGEVGSGKTMLCRMLENELDSLVDVAFLSNPSLFPQNIFHAVGRELGLKISASESMETVQSLLRDHLQNKQIEKRQVVALIEEAQGMPLETLNALRDFAMPDSKQPLLQLVLFGQPEMDQRLKTVEGLKLTQHINYEFRLRPFNRQEVADYIAHRLIISGHHGAQLFNRWALSEVYRVSEGLVRRIHTLSHKSLMAAYSQKKHRIYQRHVRLAVRDSDVNWQRNETRRKNLMHQLMYAGEKLKFWQSPWMDLTLPVRQRHVFTAATLMAGMMGAGGAYLLSQPAELPTLAAQPTSISQQKQSVNLPVPVLDKAIQSSDPIVPNKGSKEIQEAERSHFGHPEAMIESPRLIEDTKHIDSAVKPMVTTMSRTFVRPIGLQDVVSIPETVIALPDHLFEEEDEIPQASTVLLDSAKPLTQADVLEPKSQGSDVVDTQSGAHLDGTSVRGLRFANQLDHLLPEKTRMALALMNERIISGRKWVMRSSGQRWSLQVLSLDAMSNQRRLAERLFTEVNSKTLEQIHILRDQQGKITVCFGDFDSEQSARKGVTHLPKIFKAAGPFPKRLANIRRQVFNLVALGDDVPEHR